jgi:hypothetical protein
MPSTAHQHTHRFRPQPLRDPANELYDRACDLVAATAELRATAVGTHNDAAVAATLNCLEAALEDAACVVDHLQVGSTRRIRSAWPVLGEEASIVSRSISGEFADAAAAIRAAARACGHLRQAAGPLLAELNAV